MERKLHQYNVDTAPKIWLALHQVMSYHIHNPFFQRLIPTPHPRLCMARLSRMLLSGTVQEMHSWSSVGSVRFLKVQENYRKQCQNSSASFLPSIAKFRAHSQVSSKLGRMFLLCTAICCCRS